MVCLSSLFFSTFEWYRDYVQIRSFVWSKLHEKNESKRDIYMLCGIDPIHLYWIADTEMLESFLIWLDQYSSTISIVYIEIKSVYNELNNFSINRKSGGYGEIGRRYGLNWIEPWYGNLLSDNFQIQRNPGIQKKWVILSQILFYENQQNNKDSE